MLKKFVVLLLLMSTLVIGQEYRLWDKTVTNVAATTSYSSIIDINEDVSIWGNFHGLIGLALDVDSLLGYSSNDSMIFLPQYLVAGNWVTGDTIDWIKITSDDAHADTITWVIPETHLDWVMYWRTDPTSVYLQGYPISRFRVMRIDRDSSYYNLDLRLNKY